jgi:hypothetical protein
VRTFRLSAYVAYGIAIDISVRFVISKTVGQIWFYYVSIKYTNITYDRKKTLKMKAASFLRNYVNHIPDYAVSHTRTLRSQYWLLISVYVAVHYVEYSERFSVRWHYLFNELQGENYALLATDAHAHTRELSEALSIRAPAVHDVYSPYVKFEVLSAVSMKSSFFWDITLCNPIKINRRLGPTHRLHLQVENGAGQEINVKQAGFR